MDIVNVDDIKKLKETEKAPWFLSLMYHEFTKFILDITDGIKSFDELGKPLPNTDYLEIPQCPKLRLKHIEITNKFMDTFKQNEFLSQEDESEIKLFPVVIQSGGFYNEDFDKASDENYFNDDVIIVCLGLQYKQYYSNITRTIMITPTKNNCLKKNYKFLLRVEKFIIVRLRDGVLLGKVYQDTLNYVKNKRPHLLQHLTENFGSLIGSELKDNVYVIKANSNEEAKENMNFIVSIGFHSIYDDSVIQKPPHMYSLWIADCVKVKKGIRASILKNIIYRPDCAILRRPRRMHLLNECITQRT